MLKNIASVIAGYIVTAACIFIVFSAAYKLLGAEGSFKPGSFEVSGVWSLIGIVTSFSAATLGGFVCAAMAKNKKAVYALAGLIVVLGVVSAAMETSRGSKIPKEGRSAELSNHEAMMNARQPLFMLILNPVLGFAGVLLGGRLRKIA